ncbi:MAG: lysophospholipid acyltransferase family protein [Kiritimatiellia bacterium]
MNQKKDDRVFKIDPATAPVGMRNPIARRIVERAVGLHKLDKILSDGRRIHEEDASRHFCDDILLGMDVQVVVPDEDRGRIPRTGPVIVASNHPFGGIEGVVMLSILNSVRPDAKVMANYLLQLIPEMRDMFIPVNPFGSSKAAKQNIKPLLETMKWLRDGHVLGVFPSGEVSSIDLRSGSVRDPAWSTTIAGIARKTGATIVPMFFAGRNPALFQIAGLVHPRLRTVMLPTMTSKKTSSTIEVFIGSPIAPAEVAKFKDDEDLTKYMRLRTYSLAGRATKSPRHRLLRLRRLRKQAANVPEEILAETPVEAIEADIATLPPEAHLLDGAGLQVFIAKLPESSAILREIGRLREITFRAVGEGTGRKIDIDVFDSHYHHLFLWNTKNRQVVGAYRLGLADEIVARFGVRGLYTNTLFKFNEKLLRRFQPAIELGRSFVRPEYQRNFAPLLFLWKGIGAFIGRNPQYANLFGPVSITADYRDTSRNMLLRSLRLSNFSTELSRFVKPRRKPRKSKVREEWQNPDFQPFISDVDEVSTIIQDIEKDGKGIPILIRQYLKLGGKILAFNLDTDFSDVVDGLILIDLRKTDPRTRARYMGDEADGLFREHHQPAP